MNNINGNDDESSDFLARDLSSLITALGERALNSMWLCGSVECYGGNVDELDALSDQQIRVDGGELLRIVKNIDNIVDGYFRAFHNDETEPWLIVRAIDNSIYKYHLIGLLPPAFKPTRKEVAPSQRAMPISKEEDTLKKFSLAINDNGLAISELLKQMQAHGSHAENFIIFIADEKKDYYIQATPHSGDPSWLHTEAVGNENLDHEYELQPAQVEQMQRLGWKKDPHYPNFVRVWPATSDGERRFIARIIKQTFVKVYGMRPRQPIQVEMMSPRSSVNPLGKQGQATRWDAIAYAEEMKHRAAPVAAFFLIDSIDAITTCKQWLAWLKPYHMPDMEHSPYFAEVHKVYESNRKVVNFDYEFDLTWESKEYPGLLRCHYFDQGRYEIELWFPGVIANDIAEQFSDGHKGFWCGFMPPAFYD